VGCREKLSKKMKEAEIVEPAVIPDSEDEGEMVDDDMKSYEPIEILQDAGINATDITKLKEDGFATVGQLFQVSMKRLLQVKGISEAKADKLLQAARKVRRCCLGSY